MMTEIPGTFNPDDDNHERNGDDETGNQDEKADNYQRLTDASIDENLTRTFREHLPFKPLPQEIADKLKRDVLGEVASTFKGGIEGEKSQAEIDAEFYELMNRTEATAEPEQPSRGFNSRIKKFFQGISLWRK